MEFKSHLPTMGCQRVKESNTHNYCLYLGGLVFTIVLQIDAFQWYNYVL